MAETETNEEVMSEELDAVLAKADQRLAIQQWFQSQGASTEQATVAANSQFEKFAWNGTLLFDGEPVNASDKAEKFFRKNVPFLMGEPPEAVDRAVIDPALLEKAFVRHSPDARAEVLRRVGRDEVKLDKLAQDYGLRDAKDYRKGVGTRPNTDTGDTTKSKNPWSAESWSIQKQNELVRKIGFRAASEIAASADSFVGATKPGAKPLIPRARAS
jgi:hypothetical protein